MASTTAILCCLVSTCILSAYCYSIETQYSGNTFFNGFHFFTDDDPTQGYVNYVGRQQAINEGLVNVTEQGKVYIGCDWKRVASGRGRDSVRLQSAETYTEGLFVIDLDHMPQGCGTWPAFWLVGPDWPNNGEIDIIEGVNTNAQDQTTLHTNQGCSMANEGTPFTGNWGTGSNGQPATNCWVDAPNQYSNQGCGIIAGTGSYGKLFNSFSGGVFATEWTENFIRVWFFDRDNIPSDLNNNQPDPSTWGEPYAYFQLGSNCPASHFQNHQIIINLTFCGQWAGGVFGQQCPNRGDCNSFVQYNPELFTEAYWLINYVKVFKQ